MSKYKEENEQHITIAAIKKLKRYQDLPDEELQKIVDFLKTYAQIIVDDILEKNNMI